MFSLCAALTLTVAKAAVAAQLKKSKFTAKESKPTMRGSTADIPVAVEVPQGTIRQVEWGGMAIELGSFLEEIDPSPLFKGLPDDRCQCPHWGYVLRGQVRFTFADRVEVYKAGDVYYAPAGHTPLIGANTEWVEFSPIEPYQQTMEVVGRNMAAMHKPE